MIEHIGTGNIKKSLVRLTALSGLILLALWRLQSMGGNTVVWWCLMCGFVNEIAFGNFYADYGHAYRMKDRKLHVLVGKGARICAFFTAILEIAFCAVVILISLF